MRRDECIEARCALQKIQQFWTLDESDWQIKRLSGGTNQLYFVAHAGEQYVLRLPRPGMEKYIDFHHEYACAREAARVGVGPDLVYFDENSGVAVLRFIDEGVTGSPALFQAEPETVQRALSSLRKLHGSNADFVKDFDYATRLENYLSLLVKKNYVLPSDYVELLGQAKQLLRELSAQNLPRVACHGEPVCENFILTPLRIWLVDWEYAGMTDPLWDVAQFAVESGTPSEQHSRLLADYLQREPQIEEQKRLTIYKLLSDVLWTAWALNQLTDDNSAEVFQTQVELRLNRAKGLAGAAGVGNFLIS